MIKQYEKFYIKLQKLLSNKLLKAKSETEIALIRRQREKLGETYQTTMGILNASKN